MKSARKKEQSFGLWLSEPFVFQHQKLEDAVRDLAKSGYGIIRVMLRRTNLTHRSPAVVDAVRTIVKTALAEEVKIDLDCELLPEPLSRDLGELFPAAIGSRLVRGEATVTNGQFVIHIRAPSESGAPATFLGVESAFLFAPGALPKHLVSLQFDLRYEEEAYDSGFTSKEYSYTEGRPGLRWHHAHLTGHLNGVTDARLVVYARFTDRKKVDFWSQDCWNYFDKLLECYRGIPLSGIGWGEPATDGDWSTYKYGEAFAAAFERLNGYSLSSRLYFLDEPGASLDSVRVRLDYYRTLNEGLLKAQQRLYAKANELFGPELLRGTHHTWQGEGAHTDYRAGAVDYFRLNDDRDAGYTDCWWWDTRSVAYAYTLASSLGRLTPSGEGEVNTWDMKPTNSLTEYNARLMTLMDINWFNIWYGESSDTCLYPSHYTWPTAVKEAKRNRVHQLLLKDAKPVIEIAILHGWEGVCAINRSDIAAAHKGFSLNISELFIDRGVAFDWIDSGLISEAEIEDEYLVNRLGSYRILVLPYASALPRSAWEKVVAFARVGGKVVFLGTPPEFDVEGQSICEEFAAIVKMPPLTVNQYLAGIDRQCVLPQYRALNIDVCYLLDGLPDRLLVSIEGEPHGIRNEAGNVVYLTDLCPTTKLLEVVTPWLQPQVECHSDSMLWRLYCRDETQILVLAARKDRTLRGIVRFAGRTLEFSGGVVALLEANGEGSFIVHGDQIGWRVVV